MDDHPDCVSTCTPLQNQLCYAPWVTYTWVALLLRRPFLAIDSCFVHLWRNQVVDLEFRKPFSRSWKGLENCKNQEYPWKDLEFWRDKLDLRWKQDPRVEQLAERHFVENLWRKVKIEARAGRAQAGIDAKADGMSGRISYDCARTSIARRWDLHHGLGRLSKASNWRWKWQEGHEVVLLFAWVLPEDSTSTYCMNHGRDVALLTRLSGLQNTKISSLVDHHDRDRRSPTTELKNLKVMFVVMKKILESQSCKAKLQQNFSERHGNSWTFRSADGAFQACVRDRVVSR